VRDDNGLILDPFSSITTCYDGTYCCGVNNSTCCYNSESYIGLLYQDFRRGRDTRSRQWKTNMRWATVDAVPAQTRQSSPSSPPSSSPSAQAATFTVLPGDAKSTIQSPLPATTTASQLSTEPASGRLHGSGSVTDGATGKGLVVGLGLSIALVLCAFGYLIFRVKHGDFAFGWSTTPWRRWSKEAREARLSVAELDINRVPEKAPQIQNSGFWL
jgi:hypothetical protein